MKQVIVKVLVYDTHGVDNSITKQFDSLQEGLDYIFE